jgi:hypothetical protein
MVDYGKGSHTVYEIQYHFVWVTKYRYHVLGGEVAKRARELILQSCLSREIKIIKGHVSNWTLSISWTGVMWQGKLDLSKQGEIKCRPCHQRL